MVVNISHRGVTSGCVSSFLNTIGGLGEGLKTMEMKFLGPMVE